MATTQYYKLKQWAQGERPRRTEANETLTKIDSAIHGVKAAGDGNLSTLRRELASEVKTLEDALEKLDREKCAVSMGTYIGNGADNRTISLGFTPDAVLVEDDRGTRDYGVGSAYGGLALNNAPLSSEGRTALSIVGGGFTVYMDGDRRAYLNSNGVGYRYLAFRLG